MTVMTERQPMKISTAQPESTSVENIRQLVDSYNEFSSRRVKEAEERAQSLGATLDTFLTDFQNARTRWLQRDQSEAPRFNLFRLFKLQELERYHSKLLAELLDPKGTHGQATFFLERFLDRIQLGHLKSQISGPSGQVWVRLEHPITATGRVDLIVRCNRRLVLVIENKIHSDEGEDPDGLKQLKKYWAWLQDQPEAEKVLVFLTVHDELGSVPEAKRLSYSRDIRAWLQDCLQSGLPERVKETLRQYMEAVEDLRELRSGEKNAGE